MKVPVIVALLAFLSVAVFPSHDVFGQVPEFKSVEVASDRRVTFRFLAPKAQEVSVVAIENQPAAPMTRNADGVWSVTVGPLPPAIYSYAFKVDGAQVTDPMNPRVKVWLVSNSMVEVPGDPPQATQVQDVPHGVVHAHTYSSKSLGETRGVIVYTPPGYSPSAAAAFPVLYLLHGFGDDQRAWTDVGRAHVIADNLIAARAIVPLVIVMPYGHGIPPTDRRARGAEWAQNDIRFTRDLLEDVMPFVERSYRVASDPDHRAIAGLSMGGGQSLTIGLQRQDLFHWVIGFSSSAPEGDLAALFPKVAAAAAFNKESRLLWIGVGKDDFLLKRNQAFDQWLTATGVTHTYVETAGAHTWLVWRTYLQDVLPKLFR